ncbi:unnamed protein product [Brassicogethes aeneus]|uniref:G-protein coupled receptors family 3 profile domain-containing protein n=1 Tax=Brassicogethes aeneus TaxID=1431903 RepID=A0A9P0FB00_BRAAE|nr:unnamed protein product [Brassicogethes aeneus]
MGLNRSIKVHLDLFENQLSTESEEHQTIMKMINRYRGKRFDSIRYRFGVAVHRRKEQQNETAEEQQQKKKTAHCASYDDLHILGFSSKYNTFFGSHHLKKMLRQWQAQCEAGEDDEGKEEEYLRLGECQIVSVRYTDVNETMCGGPPPRLPTSLSMARAAFTVATLLATCCCQVHATQDRHARSGDLDRGPPVALQRRLEMSTEFFLIPPTPAPAGHITKTVCAGCPAETEKIAGYFREETWVIPVLALSSIAMIMIAGFEVFVLCKAWRTTPSRRHLFLGQMLLLGLFACAALGAVVTASPTQLTCAAVRFGTGVAYAIVFASLLVKCVFLISLNGGVYLPAPYQGLLLLFAILIQIAIGVQWLVTNPPSVMNVDTAIHSKHKVLVTAEDISNPAVIPLCRTPYSEILMSLIYVVFLILFVTVLAVKSRRIRDNYREATYIGLSVGCSIPTWLVWTVSGLVVSERHRDACIAFGLVISSISVFLIMFMPKGRQLAAMGKEGVYVEDREDRFSSLSRAGSGYSPSFFHFKPIKYGFTHGNTHKHQHTVTTLGGDLGMYPAPPSYNRLYQYQCYPSPPGYYSTRCPPGGVFLRPDDGNVYTTLEPTLSSNPNVYFQRGNGVHPGMMY